MAASEERAVTDTVTDHHYQRGLGAILAKVQPASVFVQAVSVNDADTVTALTRSAHYLHHLIP